jgi:hypothetical protein
MRILSLVILAWSACAADAVAPPKAPDGEFDEKPAPKAAEKSEAPPKQETKRAAALPQRPKLPPLAQREALSKRLHLERSARLLREFNDGNKRSWPDPLMVYFFEGLPGDGVHELLLRRAGVILLEKRIKAQGIRVSEMLERTYLAPPFSCLYRDKEKAKELPADLVEALRIWVVEFWPTSVIYDGPDEAKNEAARKETLERYAKYAERDQ